MRVGSAGADRLAGARHRGGGALIIFAGAVQAFPGSPRPACAGAPSSASSTRPGSALGRFLVLGLELRAAVVGAGHLAPAARGTASPPDEHTGRGCAPARTAPRSGNTRSHARTTCASHEQSVRPGTRSPDVSICPSRRQALTPKPDQQPASPPHPGVPGDRFPVRAHPGPLRLGRGMPAPRPHPPGRRPGPLHICPDCARGVITAVIIDERFHSSGLGTRALSHLRSRHTTTAWRSTATRRTARDLLRRRPLPDQRPATCTNLTVTVLLATPVARLNTDARAIAAGDLQRQRRRPARHRAVLRLGWIFHQP